MKISIVYESNYGHTAKVAEAVATGARSVADVEVSLIKIGDDGTADLDALTASDAIIFGSPTYNGALGWRMKRFFEGTTTPIWTKLAWRNKIAAGFTNSGALSGDKLGTLVSMALFAAQNGMTWVNLDMLPASSDDGELNRLGSWLGVMTQSDNASPEVTPPAGDLKTAEYLGRRVAELTTRFAAA